MPLQGFDRPRPAPRAPNWAQQKLDVPDAVLNEKWIDVQATKPKPPKTMGTGHRSEKPSIPQLNVITNFSQPSQTRKMSVTERREKESLQDRRRQKQAESKGRLGGLRAEKVSSGLSPSDRELMIGMAIPGPPAVEPRKAHLVSPPHRHNSRRPEIIVTPADTKSPWQETLQPQIRNRRKPTSSVYSRYPDGSQDPSSAPPVPHVDRASTATSIETSSTVSSWAADYSDDDTSDAHHSRPESRQSQRTILRSNSAGTLNAKYRSQGWWNHVLSPFLDRSGTVKTTKSPSDDPKSTKQQDLKAGNWKIDKTRARRQSYVHSIWADLTGRNIAKKPTTFFDHTKDPEFNDYPGVHRGETVLSPSEISEKSPQMTQKNQPTFERSRGLGLETSPDIKRGGDRSPEILGMQSMGLAAEYYVAYWYDQNHPSPYFKCENHVCAYGQRGGLHPDVPGPQKPEAPGAVARGLDEPEASSTIHIPKLKEPDTSSAATESAPKELNVGSGTSSEDVVNAIKSLERTIHLASSARSGESSISARSGESSASTGKAEDATIAVKSFDRGVLPTISEGSRSIDSSDSTAKAADAVDTVKALDRLGPPGTSRATRGAEPSSGRSSTMLSYPGQGRESRYIDDDDDDDDDGATHIADAKAMPITRTLSPAPSNQRGRVSPIPRNFGDNFSPIPDNFGDDFPHATSKPLPQPANSTRNEAMLSPEAMTPGMRADYRQNRALPMLPPAENAAAEMPPGGRATAASNDRSAPAGPQMAEYRSFQAWERNGEYTVEINDARAGGFQPQTRAVEEEEATTTKKPSKFKLMLKGLFNKKSKKDETKDKKKRRRQFCFILLGLFIMVLAVVIPVIIFTLPRDDIPAQTSWLNISGYPPIPTGIATIVRPNPAVVNGCVEPPTLWSCALPKEQQASIAPNQPNQPNFRVEIRFENGTNLTSNATFSRRSDDGRRPVMEAMGRHLWRARDSFTSNLFSPSPAPPNEEDQAFLGNTTDNNTEPFAGEATPFFMSFLDASQQTSSSKVRKRQVISLNPTSNSTNASDPFPNLQNDIPAPDINSDGTAAAANLYPLPSAQPLMLYNRGKVDEHYGFYTYFDRSIFLKSASVDNITTIGVVPDDENGGSEESAASLRCTWAQTRFLVQIWTNAQSAVQLLNSSTASQPTGTTSGAAATQTPAGSSSAEVFTPPGSFPYPVTISLDRHGGDINEKSVYCYGMDDREHIVSSERKFQLENRAFGGQLVNPAIGLFSKINVSLADGGPGGIDGGIGGCGCQWKNFDDTGVQL